MGFVFHFEVLPPLGGVTSPRAQDGPSDAGAVICGLSMGGNIALELALSQPHHIKGLILASTGAGSDHPDEFRKRVNGWADLALSDGIAAFAEMIMKVPTFAEYADRGESERRWMYDAIIANSAHGVAHTMPLTRVARGDSAQKRFGISSPSYAK